MSDIPEDVMKAAIKAFGAICEGRSDQHVIARAILSERERCAKVAERTEISAVLGVGILDGIQMGRRQIAAAIRAGT